ncbi:MAG: ATP-dependent metallopeptidase FtsH/Yme1/Tma family protein, partial [Bacteroidota bacterium]
MNNKNQGNPQGGSGKSGFNFYWIYAIIAVVLIVLMVFNGGSEGAEANYAQVKSWAEGKLITRIEYNGTQGVVFLNDQGKSSLKGQYPEAKSVMGSQSNGEFWFNIPPSDHFVEELYSLSSSNGFEMRYQPPNETAQSLIWWLIALGVMIAAWTFIMRRMSGGGG